MDQIENYFKKKNIDVSLNTLGGNQRLIDLFISETKHIVDQAYNKTSNTVKTQCYKKYYDMEERTKFTGFEKFNELDRKCRQKMSQKAKGLIGEASIAQEDNHDVSGSYIEELKNSFKNFKNPLLYLSGGIDSEFVALVMLEEKISFIPVIFQWTNDAEKVLNVHDILYAMDFCTTHNLTPITRNINIEKLWNNPEFIDLAIETNNISPHINTYAYMIEMMAEEYKDSTHVLGGEVRFSRMTEEGRIANYVALAKVSPPTYNGVTYTQTANRNYTDLFTSAMFIELRYFWDGNYGNNQTWDINYSTSAPSGSPQIGTWFNADLPGGTGFESRVSYAGGGYSSWTDISVGTNVVASVSMNGSGDSNSSDSKAVSLQVRSKADGTIVTSTFTFSNVYTYTPALVTFSPGTFGYTTPAGITSYSILVVGGGGGGGGAVRSSGVAGENNGAAGGGGGGATGQGLTGVTSLGTIAFTIGSGGSGSVAADGLDGDATSATLPSFLMITGSAGNGGKKNPSPATRVGGAGGPNLSYLGGAGAAGSSIEESFGGGGAGSGGNGGAATDSSPGTGGSGTLFALTKNASVSNITYGQGGQGGEVFGSSTSGPVPGGGGAGDGVLWFDGDPPAEVAGSPGADGRVYIYI